MSPQPPTTPVRAAHRIDQAALERYLARHVPDAVPIRAVSQFAAGQSNPTYLIEGPARRFVLRKKPPGTLLPSAHLVEREYRILAALAGTDVPVPRVHHLCEDTGIVGTAFYVMDYVEGSVDQDPAWPAFAADRRRALYDSMADVLARLHNVDWRGLGLGDYGVVSHIIGRRISQIISGGRCADFPHYFGFTGSRHSLRRRISRPPDEGAGGSFCQARWDVALRSAGTGIGSGCAVIGAGPGRARMTVVQNGISNSGKSGSCSPSSRGGG